jgi:phenylpropionate dioxygenase-like ring-hydroxylating dioxygenase large terminal subunit
MDGLETRQKGDFTKLPTRVDIAKIISPEYYAVEREKVFRRGWLCIGHTTELPQKGSYYVYEMPTFDTSLLVVRGQDDKVRVFHNACRHRGNKLVREGTGCRPNFMCNFHGWVFSSEGELRVITDEHQFEDVNKEELGLVEVTSEIWETLIFVNFDATPRESLKDYLGPMFDQYANYFENHIKVGAQRVVLDCNWHLVVNSFTEGYHTLYIHKDTARDYQGGKTNPQRHRPWMELFERHHRYSAPGNPDHVILPAEAVAIKHGRKLLPAFDFDSTDLPPGVNPSRFDKWAFDVVEFFPNLVILTGKNFRAQIFSWPISAGKTLVIFQNWLYKPKNFGERISQSYFRSRGRDVVREDLNTMEAQQQGLTSGAIKEIVLSKQETALRHHYKVLEETMSQP